MRDILESWSFSIAVTFVIVLNTAWLDHRTNFQLEHILSETNTEENTAVARIVEATFNIVFLAELVARIAVHRLFFFINDNWTWNNFDFIVVMMSCGEFLLQKESNNNLTFARLLRIFKLAKIMRVVRFLRMFRELENLLESFTRSISSLFWVFIIMVFMIYVFALIFSTAVLGHLIDNPGVDPAPFLRLFGSTTTSMLSLYMSVTGGMDWEEPYSYAVLCGFLYAYLFIVFSFTFGFALFNIITAVIVEKAVRIMAPAVEDELATYQQTVLKEMEMFRSLCGVLDMDCSGTITYAEFQQAMSNQQFADFFGYMDINIANVASFFDVVAGGLHAEIDFDHFVRGAMVMKGNAKALEVEKVSWDLTKCQRQLDRFEGRSIEKLKEIQELCQRMVPRTPCGEPCESVTM